MNHPDQTQERLGKVMIYLAWLLLLGILTLFFEQWLERRENPNQRLASYTSEAGVREVLLKRNHSGHYVAPGYINGQPVRFLVDTGASHISIPASLAEGLGLNYGSPLRAVTANGVITVHSTILGQVALGNIVFYKVRASINPYMHDDVVLLGMSFMQDLEIIQKGALLTLRQY